MTRRELERPPGLLRLYARGVISGLRGGDELPDEVLALPEVEVDRDHLARYQRVCGFRIDDRLPPTYLHVVAFPLAVQLMVDPSFPFALPGLVHIANRITVEQPLTAADRPAVEVHVEDLRPHPKGRQFSVLASASVDGATAWSSVSTYLKRGDGGGGDAPPELPDPHRGATAHWEIPANTGRRYAAVSGDRNPIHLHPLSAKLFGFPRQIAHGMWTKARCLAAVEERLPERLDVDVRFLRPLVLPSEVAFTAEERDGEWVIGLDAVGREDAHLRGVVEAR